MANAFTILKDTRKLLSKGRWIKGESAKNQLGEVVTAASPEACQWCLHGAIIRSTVDNDAMAIHRSGFSEAVQDVENAITEITGLKLMIPNFNDAERTTWQDVVAVLDKAIERRTAFKTWNDEYRAKHGGFQGVQAPAE